VREQWPEGHKPPDQRAVQAKYKEITARARQRQASAQAQARSGQHNEPEEPWVRSLLDNMDAQQRWEEEMRAGKEKREEKDRETHQRHGQLRDDAMVVLTDKSERKEKRDHTESTDGSSADSEESSGKKPRGNVRTLLQESIEQGGVRHKEQLAMHRETQQTFQSGVALINTTMQKGNDLFEKWITAQMKGNSG
jgi:hypothetical protein